MKLGVLTGLCVLTSITSGATAQAVSAAWFQSQIERVPPVESPHQRASNGVSAWTLSYVLKDGPHSAEPLELIVARHGHVLYRLHDGPFYWRFRFLDGGAQLAVEHGPRHEPLDYELLDVKTGRIRDTWHVLSPTEPPAWVMTLSDAEGTPGHIDRRR